MTLLYHYFERARGPFQSVSRLPLAEGEAILEQIRQENRVFAAHRFAGYLERRLELEAIVRARFIAKGGKPLLTSPHYLVWEACPWLQTWYTEPACIAIPLEEFDQATVSFTYGDSFPTFSSRVNDGRAYRETVYTSDEITEIITAYGLPQEWNPQGELGPERYIEAHVWSDDPISKHIERWRASNPR